MDKERLISVLNKTRHYFERLRDTQQVVECEDKDDICNYFDQVMDSIDNLVEKVRRDGK